MNKTDDARSELFETLLSCPAGIEKAYMFYDELVRQGIMKLYFILPKVNKVFDILNEHGVIDSLGYATLKDQYFFDRMYAPACASAFWKVMVDTPEVTENNAVAWIMENFNCGYMWKNHALDMLLRLYYETNKLKKELLNAISISCEVNSTVAEKRKELEEKVKEAFPCGIQLIVSQIQWIAKNKSTFERCDISDVLAIVPTEELYASIHEAVYRENANDVLDLKNKDEFIGYINHHFKIAIVSEAIDCYIKQGERRTAQAINKAIKQMIEEKTDYIYFRYVQIFYLAHVAEDNKVMRDKMDLIIALQSMVAGETTGFVPVS